MASPNVVHPQVESHGAGRPDLQRRWRQVQVVTTMPYWLGETYDHLFPLPPIPLEVPVKIRLTASRRIY